MDPELKNYLDVDGIFSFVVTATALWLLGWWWLGDSDSNDL